MTAETLEGTMEKAYGVTLPNALSYKGTFETFDSIDEVKAANEFPSNEEVVNFLNQQRRNNARQSFMTKALNDAGIEKPTIKNSVELRIKNIVDSLVAGGKSPADADRIARRALELE